MTWQYATPALSEANLPKQSQAPEANPSNTPNQGYVQQHSNRSVPVGTDLDGMKLRISQTHTTASMPKRVTMPAGSIDAHDKSQFPLKKNCPCLHSEHSLPVYPSAHSKLGPPLHWPELHGKKMGGVMIMWSMPGSSRILKYFLALNWLPSEESIGEDTRSSASAQKPAFGNGSSALPCPEPCISPNATVELWQPCEQMPAAIGAGRQPEQDSRCTGRLVGTQNTADREVRHGATCLQLQESGRVPPIGPCSVPCPACSYSKAQQRDRRTHGAIIKAR